jgi:hypothetical protein
MAALALAGSQAAFAAVTVHDPLHQAAAMSQWIKQIENTIAIKTQDAQAYYRHFQHMQQQLTKLSQVFKLSQLTMTQDMTERSLTYGSEVCGSNGSLSLTSMFKALAPNLNGDVVAQQQQKCHQIVRLQNMKYNEYVRLLKNLDSRSQEIARLEQQISTSDSNGKLDTNVAQAQSIISKTLADSQYSMSMINVYDGMIVTLKDDQKNLGTRALKGSQDPLAGLEGTLVQGATLKVALEALSSKSR